MQKQLHRSDFLKIGLVAGAGSLAACSGHLGAPVFPQVKPDNSRHNVILRTSEATAALIDAASGKTLIAATVERVADDLVVSATSDFGVIPLRFRFNSSQNGVADLGHGVSLKFSDGASSFAGSKVKGALARVGAEVVFDCSQAGLNGTRTAITSLIPSRPRLSPMSELCDVLRDEYNWAMAGFVLAGISWIAMPLDPIAAGATGLAAADVQHILNEMKAHGCAK